MNRRMHVDLFRRIARGGGAPNAAQVEAALEAVILNAMTPYSWADAAHTTTDGGTGKTASFVDKVLATTGIRAITASHAYVQATSGNQCALPSADALLRGKLAATWVATTAYLSNSPASSWRIPHDSTGFESFFVHRRTSAAGTQYIWATHDGATGTGASHLFGAPNVTAAKVYNAGVLTVNMSAVGDTTGGTYGNTQFNVANTPDAALLYRANAGSTANITAGVSAGDPASTMVLGNTSGKASGTLSSVVEFLCFARVLSAADRSIVRAYFNAKYGIL